MRVMSPDHESCDSSAVKESMLLEIRATMNLDRRFVCIMWETRTVSLITGMRRYNVVTHEMSSRH